MNQRARTDQRTDQDTGTNGASWNTSYTPHWTGPASSYGDPRPANPRVDATPVYGPLNPVPPHPFPPHPFPPHPSFDPRALYGENARLRQLLSAARVATARQAEAIRQHTEQLAAQRHDELSRQLDEMQARLADEAEQAGGRLREKQEEIDRLREQVAEAQKSALANSAQVTILKRELENVAIVAAAEQRDSCKRHETVVGRLRSLVDEGTQNTTRLQAEVDERNELLELWYHAHDQAATLCECYERDIRQQRDILAETTDEYTRFRAETAAAFQCCDDEIETLEATVRILRTDHESVERINDDLDQLVDRLQSEQKELQRELESQVVSRARDRQESTRAIESLREELHTTKSRLISVAEERKSLVQSVAKLKTASDQYDASMFAKDQEIDATKRMADDAQRQLEQLRREHAVLAGQCDDLRNRHRETCGSLQQLEQDLEQAVELAELAESKAGERDRQLREVQSAARAAEANALLRASEAEQQFAIEIDRLESKLQEKGEAEARQQEASADHEAELKKLQHEIEVSRQAAVASAAENDRLQQTIDRQNQRVGDLEVVVQAKESRIALLEDSLAEASSDASKQGDDVAQLRRELETRRAQMAEYADRIATQQRQLVRVEQELSETKRQPSKSQVEQDTPASESNAEQAEASNLQWQAKVSELEQNQLALRERHHQALLAQEKNLEALRSSESQLIAERDVLAARVNELTDQINGLRGELDEWSRFENPIQEARRLSTELARRIAEHARDRETLFERIETLQQQSQQQRAA